MSDLTYGWYQTTLLHDKQAHRFTTRFFVLHAPRTVLRGAYKCLHVPPTLLAVKVAVARCKLLVLGVGLCARVCARARRSELVLPPSYFAFGAVVRMHSCVSPPHGERVPANNVGGINSMPCATRVSAPAAVSCGNFLQSAIQLSRIREAKQ